MDFNSAQNHNVTKLVEDAAVVTAKRLPDYYGESPWHRNWKKAFPKDFREVGFTDGSGELHRADIHTTCGTTIEFQNSPISLDELMSRESFYPKLVWVLNGKKFKGFRVLKNLPDVGDPKLAAYEFRQTDHLSMVRKVDFLHYGVNAKVLNFHHAELRDFPLTSYYYSFCWKQPHCVWYQAKAPLVIDLGGHFLYQLKHRRQFSGDYSYLHMIPRKRFIEQYTVVTV